MQKSGTNILLLLLIPILLQAQYKFDRAKFIGTIDGLPSSVVTSISKDEDGFMWFGTYHGLCRYDGTHMEIFRPDDEMLLPLIDFVVHSLLINGDSIWIGSQAGLLLFNRASQQFEDFPFDEPDNNKKIDRVVSIIQDKRGDLWLGVRDRGILRFSIRDQEFNTFTYEDKKNTDLSTINKLKHIDQVLQDVRYDSILWAATAVGLLQLDKVSGEMHWYRQEFADEKKENISNELCTLHQEPDGKLYLGTFSDGVKVFDPETETISDLSGSIDSEGRKILETYISHLSSSGNPYLWISAKDGLLQYDIPKRQFVKTWKNDDIVKYGITHVDEAGRIWYAHQPGIFLFDPLLQQFDYSRFRNKPEKTGSIPRMILEDEKTGDLTLIAQYSEGIMHLDRSSGQWTLIPAPEGFLSNEPYFHGWGIVKNEENSFLVLESDYGLFYYRPSRSRLGKFSHQPDTYHNKFKPIIRDHKGRIWIGSHMEGLIRFDPETQQFSYFKEELEPPELEAFVRSIVFIFIDSRQNLWIRRHLGYSVYLTEQDSFLNLLHLVDSNNPSHVENFAEDRNGRIWMAGGTGSLLFYTDVNHPEKGPLGRITLPPEADKKHFVWYVEADKAGNIWALTSLGLARIDPDDHSIQIFSYEYGIRPMIQYLKCLNSGEMVLGHRDAISFFYPDSLQINSELPIPYITRFKVFDEDLPTDSNLQALPLIDLRFSNRQNFFSIEYTAIAYTMADKVTYQYRLDGFEDYWTDAGQRRYAAYTNVPVGDYTFQVKAVNSEGLAGKTPFEMRIKIIPPWWRTSWAYTLFAVAILAAISLFYRMHLNQKLKQAENLRLKELDALKTRLYTNITHEFRTPLTIISGMTDQIKAAPQKWFHEGLEMIKRNSLRLTNLVNQMLDLSKLEAGNLPVNIVQGEILNLLKYLVESFHSYAESKDIRMHFLTDLEELYMDYDEEKMLAIVSNLLSNAIKFTPEGGDVYVSLNRELTTGFNQMLILKVKDTGIGIPGEKLPHIFDRFYQVDDEATRKAEGSGIGLALTKELVKLLKGEISVQSKPEKGTEFIVKLPITNNAAMVEAIDGQSLREQVTTFVPLVTEDPEIISTTKTSTDVPLALIIEDNRDVIRYISGCLADEYKITVALNGQQGIDQAIELVPDIIISDVMMPEKDGMEVTKILKEDERTSHIPIVLLTAKADMESKLEGLERGADAYLAKPFNKEELLIRLRKLLELRQKLQQYYRSLASKEVTTDQSEDISPQRKVEDAFVLKVRSIIEDHLIDYKFNVQILSREVGVSRAQLHRKLTALTGYSANRFIRFIRLSKAKELLRNQELTITAVAYDTGFNDPDYFIRVFRKELGETPGQYQKRIDSSSN